MNDVNVVQLIFHLPQVRLVGSEFVDIGLGQIRHFSFDEWYSIETPGVFDWKRDYEAGQPVFVLYQMDLETSPYDKSDKRRPVPILRDLVDLVWLALIVTFGQPMPHPDLSLQYTRILYRASDQGATQDLVYPYIGYCEYDLLKSPLDVYFDIDENVAKHLQHNIALLAKMWHAGWSTTFLRLYEPLHFLGNIKVNPTDALLHLVRCFEDLTNPEGQRPLGRQFTLRFAIMTTPDEQHIQDQMALGQLLWRFRSKLLHGEGYENTLETLVGQYADLRTLIYRPLQTCAARFASLVCHWQEQPPTLTDIANRLDDLCIQTVDGSKDVTEFLKQAGREAFHTQ